MTQIKVNDILTYLQQHNLVLDFDFAADLRDVGNIGSLANHNINSLIWISAKYLLTNQDTTPTLDCALIIISVGCNVSVGANCSIGLPGFENDKAENRESFLFPHIGNVIIESGVEIGSNTCIDRGSLDSTVISKNVKIDNLVHIAHNVIIHKNALIIANAMIGGSTTIGAGSWISPSSSLLNKIEIGEGAIVGMGSVVLKNVEPNAKVAGVPAKNLNK